MAKYIDREYAFKELNDQCKITGYGGITPYDLKKVFERLPGIDMRENRQARWKCSAIGIWYCSLCNEEPYYAWDIHKYKYCPFCGAKMDEGVTE